jgi:hypothetical protein
MYLKSNRDHYLISHHLAKKYKKFPWCHDVEMKVSNLVLVVHGQKGHRMEFRVLLDSRTFI